MEQSGTVPGLAEIATSPGTQIFYSAQPGGVALDGGASGNSVFSQVLGKLIIQPDNLASIVRVVTSEVVAASNGQQQPWLAGSRLSGVPIE